MFTAAFAPRSLVLLLLVAGLGASLPAQTILHEWRFGEGDAGATPGATLTLTKDSAGSTDLTPSDVATYSTATPGTGSSRAASFTSGVYFTGSVDTSLTPTSSFVVEAWFYLNTMPATSYLFFNGSASSGFGVYVDGATAFYQTPGGAPVSTLGGVNVGAWNYLAFVYSNGAVKSYINDITTPTYNAAHDFVQPEASGGLQLGGTFVGRLDEVRVFTFSEPFGSFNTGSLNYATVGAIPEPSTYAAIAGALGLGLAVWRRRVAARS